MLRVRVTAAPADGLANRAVAGLLAAAARCPPIRDRARARGPEPRQAVPRGEPLPRRSPGPDRAPGRAAPRGRSGCGRAGTWRTSGPARGRPMISPIRWDGERLWLLDQTRLPAEEVERACAGWPEVAEAIRTLVVRGAPAIGVAAAFGVALAARASRAPDRAGLLADLDAAIAGLGATRPTAVNLFWALDRMRRAAVGPPALPPSALRARLAAEASAIQDEDLAANRAIGAHGVALVPPRRAHPYSLQCRRPRHCGLWHGPRRDPRRPRARPRGAGVGGRDAAGDAGFPAHRVGDGPGGNPAPAHRRRGGGRVDAARRGRPGHHRR